MIRSTNTRYIRARGYQQRHSTNLTSILLLGVEHIAAAAAAVAVFAASHSSFRHRRSSSRVPAAPLSTRSLSYLSLVPPSSDFEFYTYIYKMFSYTIQCVGEFVVLSRSLARCGVRVVVDPRKNQSREWKLARRSTLPRCREPITLSLSLLAAYSHLPMRAHI